MDTDWCIMCDSHCNIPGAIYCSKECELQDRLSAAYPSNNSSISLASQNSLGGSLKAERTSSVKFVVPKAPSIQFTKVQLPPQQQPTLFYHRGPPRYKHTSSKACASASNVRDRKMTKSLYVQ